MMRSKTRLVPWDDKKITILQDIIEKNGGDLIKTLRQTELPYLTWRHIITEHPEIEEYRKKCLEVCIDLAETKLIELVNKGNFNAIKFFLERKSNQYEEKQQIKIIPAKKLDN